jgi:hypothetical protein
LEPVKPREPVKYILGILMSEFAAEATENLVFVNPDKNMRKI